jgi:hypothetical protein
MPCLLGCLALAVPRLVIILLFLFSDYLERAYVTVVWPVLGFVFFPTATLAYAFAINQNYSLTGIYLVIFVIAVLIDLGLIGGGSHQSYRYHERRS